MKRLVDPVHLAVGVDDALRRVGAHPGRAHVVPGAHALAGRRGDLDRGVGQHPVVDPHPAEVVVGEPGGEGERGLADRSCRRSGSPASRAAPGACRRRRSRRRASPGCRGSAPPGSCARPGPRGSAAGRGSATSPRAPPVSHCSWSPSTASVSAVGIGHGALQRCGRAPCRRAAVLRVV